MKHLSVAKKPALSFAIILLLFIVTIACSVFIGQRNVTNAFQSFYRSPYTVTNAINNMRRQIEAMQKDMAYIVLDEPSNYQTWVDDLNSRNEDFENIIKQIEPLLISDAGKAKLRSLKRAGRS